MAPGPEGRWVRGLVRLQACARGYLVRRQVRAARADFEAVVLAVEGSLERLRWRGRHLLRPLFLDELPGADDADQEPAEANCAATRESGGSDKSNADKLQQEVPPSEASGPERAQGCGSDVKLAEPREEAAREGDEAQPGAGAGADKAAAKGSSAAAQGEERGSCEPSAWDGAVLRAGLEIPLEELRELPRTVPGLLAYRNHLIMELLWLEQAIVSRKNYLRLKKKLVAADL